MGPCAERKRCAWSADVKLRMVRSRGRAGSGQFSALLLRYYYCRCRQKASRLESIKIAKPVELEELGTWAG
jgi:hypothetical protein